MVWRPNKKTEIFKQIWRRINSKQKIIDTYRGGLTTLIVRLKPSLRRKFFKEILETPPVKASKKGKAEIHSITCHEEIFMYLLAIKSFLRYYDDVKIVVHGDGSLTKEDIETLQKHIKNIKIMTKEEADRKMKPFLKDKPRCKYFRETYPIAKQALDYHILAKNNKVISMDSDIIFLKKPNEIINWIEKKENNEILYNLNPDEKESGLRKILKNLEFDKEVKNINGGLVCYYKDFLDTNFIENTIKEMRNKNLRDWTSAQLFFNLQAPKSKYNFNPLQTEKYKVFDIRRKDKRHTQITKKETMIHFLGPGRFKKRIYPKLSKKIIRELKNEKRTESKTKPGNKQGVK